MAVGTPTPVTAVLLDLDDTLLPWQTLNHWQWAWRPRGPVLSERHTRAALKRALHRWDRRRWEVVSGKSPPVGEAEYRGFVTWTLSEIAGRPLSELESTAVVDRFLKPAGEIETFSDAAPLLKTLAERRVAVGTLSALPSESTRVALRRVGIPETLLVPAGGPEATLPSPAAFRAACAHLGAKPRTTLYIGDLFWSDVRAAGRAGCLSVLLDRTDLAARVLGPRIHSLAEVPGLLDHPPGETPEPPAGGPESEPT
jgi:HAD superfamily hydrolase (TIGR01549 family)